MFDFIRRRREKKKYAERWPAALLLLSGALKAGLPLSEALTLLVNEAPAPLRKYLKQRFLDCGDWMPLEERIDRLFVDDELALAKAILLFSHESGGKTASLLELSADLLAKKQELRERAAVLTAEGRMSAWVVGGSPFVLLFLLAWISPDFTQPLFALKAGRFLLLLVIVLVGIGLLLVNRAVRIEP